VTGPCDRKHRNSWCVCGPDLISPESTQAHTSALRHGVQPPFISLKWLSKNSKNRNLIRHLAKCLTVFTSALSHIVHSTGARSLVWRASPHTCRPGMLPDHG
jgi:hypothetical protein